MIKIIAGFVNLPLSLDNRYFVKLHVPVADEVILDGRRLDLELKVVGTALCGERRGWLSDDTISPVCIAIFLMLLVSLKVSLFLLQYLHLQVQTLYLKS